MGHGAHTPVSIYLFFHFFNFFLIDKMFFFLIIASFIATIDCKSSLAKGPLGPSPSLKTKSIFKSPGMQGGLNGWNGPEDHRQADEQKNVLKSPGMQGGLNGWNGHEDHRQAWGSWCPSAYWWLPCSKKGFRYGCAENHKCWRSCHFGQQWCWIDIFIFGDNHSVTKNCKYHKDCVRDDYTPKCNG